MTRLILVRHGETEWNRETRIQGQRDSALSPAGRAQARAVATRLAGEGAAHLVSSDLGRTMDTARAVSEATGLAIEPLPGLRERAFGIFEGRTLAEIEAAWPHEHARWRNRDPDHAMPGGESLVQLRRRVHDCLTGLAARGLASVIVVTHGGVLDAVYRIAMNLPDDAKRAWPLLNASVNRIDKTPDGWRVAAWGEVDHIEAADDETA
jgi:probable phosphoglycerate mutase